MVTSWKRPAFITLLLTLVSRGLAGANCSVVLCFSAVKVLHAISSPFLSK